MPQLKAIEDASNRAETMPITRQSTERKKKIRIGKINQAHIRSK